MRRNGRKPLQPQLHSGVTHGAEQGGEAPGGSPAPTAMSNMQLWPTAGLPQSRMARSTCTTRSHDPALLQGHNLAWQRNMPGMCNVRVRNMARSTWGM